jgi:hypothetical protein
MQTVWIVHEDECFGFGEGSGRVLHACLDRETAERLAQEHVDKHPARFRNSSRHGDEWNPNGEYTVTIWEEQLV